MVMGKLKMNFLINQTLKWPITILIMRHADALSARFRESDHLRKLSEKGNIEAKFIGKKLANLEIPILESHVSFAERTKETWRNLKSELKTEIIENFSPELYKITASEMVGFIEDKLRGLIEIQIDKNKIDVSKLSSTSGHHQLGIMILGHNPCISEFILKRIPADSKWGELFSLPPASCAIFQVKISLEELQSGKLREDSMWLIQELLLASEIVSE
jgi:phosphohistidine phosphatase SixA